METGRLEIKKGSDSTVPICPGVRLALAGRIDEAIAYFQQALTDNPDDAEKHNNLGVIYAQSGRTREAAQCFCAAIELHPHYVQAWRNWSNLQADLAQLADAIYGYQETVRIEPNDPPTWYRLGLVQRRVRALEDSITSFREALRLDPQFAEAHSTLGNSLTDLGRLGEAEVHYREALALKPEMPEGHNNLGILLSELGRLDDACACFERAIALKPDYADARTNRGIVRLLRGDFAGGWIDYEWRLRRPTTRLPRFTQDLWDGSPLDGKTILLYADQGYGDTIQFIRYASLVQERGGQVVVQVPNILTALVATAPGVLRVISQGSPLPNFDVQAPLLSLPGIFHTDLGTIPAPIPYLWADAERSEFWRQQLATLGGFRIGICWRGHPTNPGDRQRSAGLRDFAAFAAIEGVRLVSLQINDGVEEITGAGFEIFNAGTSFTSFADTAGAIMNLDVVVTVDTATAHLAGALGKPVWMLLPPCPDWRWLLEHDDSPWYPTMRLFRRGAAEGWESVVEQICRELRKIVSTRVTPKGSEKLAGG